MANEIRLGIDVDSRGVVTATRDLNKMGNEVDDLNNSFGTTSARGKAVNQTLKQQERAAGRVNKVLSGSRGLVAGVWGLVAAFTAFQGVTALQDVAVHVGGLARSFEAITGSATGAAAEMEYVGQVADDLGTDLVSSERAWRKFLGAASSTGAELGSVRGAFEGISAAGTVLGLSTGEVEGALLAVQQVISKGVVQAEELRGQLGERLPIALGATQEGLEAIAALDPFRFVEELGAAGPKATAIAEEIVRTGEVSSQQLSKMMELGALNSTLFLEALDLSLASYKRTATETETLVKAQNELGNTFERLKRVIVEEGFLDAMASVLSSLSAVASSPVTESYVRGIGSAIGYLADNADIAAGALAGIGAAMVLAGAPIAGFTAVVVGLSTGLAFLWQRTYELQGVTVSAGETIAAVWTGLAPLYNAVLSTAKEFITGMSAVFGAAAPIFSALERLAVELIRSFAQIFGGGLDVFRAFVLAVKEVLVDPMWAAFRLVIDGANAFTAAIVEWAVQAYQPFKNLVDKVRDLFLWLGEKLGKFFGKIADTYNWVAEKLGQTPLAEDLAELGAGLADSASDATGSLKALGGAVVQMGQSTRTAFDNVATAGADLNDSINTAGLGVMTAISVAAQNTVDEALGAIGELSTAYSNVQKQIDTLATVKKLEGAGFNASDEARLEKLNAELAALDEQISTQAGIVDEIEKGSKATKKAQKDAEELDSIWKGIGGSIAGAFANVGSSGDVDLGTIADEFTGVFRSGMDDAGDDFAASVTAQLEKITGAGGLLEGVSPATLSGVGVGLGTAASGALASDAGMIGTGLGQAAGAALGASVGGPVGMMIGASIGGAIGKAASSLFGRGVSSSTVKGVFGAGTAYESNQSTYLRKDRAADAKIASAGFRYSLKNFESILSEIIGDQERVAKGISESLQDTRSIWKDTYARIGVTVMDSKKAKAQAEQFERAIQEIFNLAAGVLSVGMRPITEAQAQFRAFNDQFTSENMKILRNLGISAKRISEAQETFRKELADSFEMELFASFAEVEDMTGKQMNKYRDLQLDALAEREAAALATAREIGASEALVRAAFASQRQGLMDDFASEMDGFANEIEDFSDRLAEVTRDRNEVLAELTRRSNAAAAAEETLAEARASLRISELAPGTASQRLDEAQTQFDTAIAAALGGDEGAATDAARLAQQVLSLGQEFYASSRNYSDLFKSVNDQLGRAQGGFKEQSEQITDQLTSEDFQEVTERSTESLLRALATLNDNLTEIKKESEEQNRRINASAAKARVA